MPPKKHPVPCCVCRGDWEPIIDAVRLATWATALGYSAGMRYDDVRVLRYADLVLADQIPAHPVNMQARARLCAWQRYGCGNSSELKNVREQCYQPL